MNLPTTKLTSSQYLNINDDKDIFAVILMSTVEVPLDNDLTFDLVTLRELMKNHDTPQLSTHLNLIRYAFKLNWPILVILAGIECQKITDYCWIIWLIISINLPSIPADIATYDELAKHVITCAIKGTVRTLNLSFQIFYPTSKFSLFPKFLSEASRYHFTSETSALLMDFMYENDEGNVAINELIDWSSQDILALMITWLIEFVKLGFDSMEHTQQLLDTITASGISQYVGSIDFGTVAAINKIIFFTNVRINIDEMVCPVLSDTDDDSFNHEHSDMMASGNLQNEYNRICDELIVEKEFSTAIEVANLLNLTRDTIVYEQWIHMYETMENFDFDVCDREIMHHSTSPLILINFLLYVSVKMDYGDVKKYSVQKRILNTIKKHHLYRNDGVQRDRIEYDMYKCLVKNDARIDDIEMYHSEYFETIMLAERGVLFKSFLDLKQLAGVDELAVVHKEAMTKTETERLDELINKLLEVGDIVQALRLQGIFNHRTLDLHYLVFCMALAEGLASLYELSSDQKQILNDGLKHAASKFNRRTLRLKRLSTSCSTSESSSPANKTYFDTVEPTNRVDFEEIPPGEKQDLLEAVQVRK